MNRINKFTHAQQRAIDAANRIIASDESLTPYVELNGVVYQRCINFPCFYISEYVDDNTPFTFITINNTGKVIAQSKIHNGYLQVHWNYTVNGKNYLFNYCVHQLVGQQYLVNPNPERYTEVNHINQARTDLNIISNLEWVTRRGNMARRRNTLGSLITEEEFAQLNVPRLYQYNSHTFNNHAVYFDPSTGIIYIDVEDGTYQAVPLDDRKLHMLYCTDGGELCGVVKNKLMKMFNDDDTE